MAPKKSEVNLEHLAFEEERLAKWKLLEPRILNTVSALGGLEDVLVPGERAEDEDEDGPEPEGKVESVYRLGDECLGCLKDIKKFWRLDDHDDDRTVARILYKSKVLPNDLLPILKSVEGTGSRGTRIALLCSDIIAALTWPIDVAAELRESADIDDEEAQRAAANVDYSGLVAAQLSYKRDILRSGALGCIFRLIVPALDKPRRDRTQKDENIISLVLHVLRNLAALRDRTPSHTQSAAQAEESYLQSDFVVQLQKFQIWDFLLIVAHGSGSEDFRPWNMVALDIFHLLFRGLDVPDLVASVPRGVGVAPGEVGGSNDPVGDRKLAALLENEDATKRREARKGASRHSRFGTTISVQTGGKRYHLHQQSAINAPIEKALDVKKKVTKKGRHDRMSDDLAPPVELKPAAMRVLREVAIGFLQSGFNPFFNSILSDIRMEREKVREADTVRFLYLVRFFFQFYLLLRAQEQAAGIDPSSERGHDFDLIAEMTDPACMAFVTMRMKAALEEKPVLWTELHAGVDCLIQLLLVIDELLKTGDDDAKETANQLQNRLYYEGETLDLMLNIVGSYKKQSLKYLDSIVHFAFVLLRMLEKYSKSKDYMYVRKKKAKGKKKRKEAGGDGEGEEEVVDEEEMEVEENTASYADHAFHFETFESRFSNEATLTTLMTYLRGHAGFTDPEQMKRVVKLMHRQAVNAKQYNLFFKVSTLDLMNKILDQRKQFPRQTAYDDLAKLIDFIIKRFFKDVKSNPFMLVDVLFPKRSKSEWEKAAAGRDDSDDEDRRPAKLKRMPAELEVKGGLSWSQQVGIAIGLLVDNSKSHWLDHVKDNLRNACAARTAIVLIVDGSPEEQPVPETDEEIREAAAKAKGPSQEARDKFEDHQVEGGDEEAVAARAKDAQLQLLMRLIGWESAEAADADGNLAWKIPRARLHTDIEADLRIIDHYLRNPLDHEGKSAAEMVRKKRKPRARKTRADGDADDDDGLADSDGEGKRKKRRAKRQEEVKQYKSAQFVEDSDEEDDAAFFEREKQLRAKMEAAAAAGGGAPPAPRPRAKPKRVGKGKGKPAAAKEKSSGRKKGKKPAATSDVDMDDAEEEVDELASDSDEEPAGRKAVDSSPPSSSRSGNAEADADTDQRQRSTTPPSSASFSAQSRKRSLSAASAASPVVEKTKPAKARRIVLDSDDDE